MIMKFTDALSEMIVHAQGNELAQLFAHDTTDSGERTYTQPDSKTMHVITFKNPVLVTDNYKINLLTPEHSKETRDQHVFVPNINGISMDPPHSVLRDVVHKLFESPKKTTIYGNTQLEFEQGKFNSVWGPSIDTLLFCNAIRTENIKGNLDHVKRAIEIGPGSGFISKYLLNNLPNLEEMTLIDLNEESTNCARESIDDPRTIFEVGDGLKYLEKRKFDLIVCNPPYIPRMDSSDDNPYEGIRVLEYLIRNTTTHTTPGGIILTNVSSLCEDYAREAIQQTKAYQKITAEYIKSLDVPLKVFNVAFNKKWTEYLKDKHHLIDRYKNGHSFWQTINIAKIQNCE